MELNLIRENEDGSADYHIDLTAHEQAQLIRYGLITLLEKAVLEGLKNDPEFVEGKASLGNSAGGRTSGVHGEGEQPKEPEQPGDGFKTSQVLG